MSWNKRLSKRLTKNDNGNCEWEKEKFHHLPNFGRFDDQILRESIWNLFLCNLQFSFHTFSSSSYFFLFLFFPQSYWEREEKKWKSINFYSLIRFSRRKSMIKSDFPLLYSHSLSLMLYTQIFDRNHTLWWSIMAENSIYNLAFMKFAYHILFILEVRHFQHHYLLLQKIGHWSNTVQLRWVSKCTKDWNHHIFAPSSHISIIISEGT